MIDMNDTQEVPGVMPEMAGQPTLQIDEKEVPAASDYEVGDEITATIKGKVTAKDNGLTTVEYSGADCQLTSDVMQKAQKARMPKKDFVALMSKRAANKEKMSNENS